MAGAGVLRPSVPLLVVVCVCLQSGCCSVELYVTPDPLSSPCPSSTTCKTLDQYAYNSSLYFIPGATFHLLPGTHSLKSPIRVGQSNTSEEPLQLLGVEGETIISCHIPLSLFFTNYSSLTLAQLVISGCGTDDKPALYFNSINTLQLMRLTIINSSSTDIVALDVGNMTVSGSSFSTSDEQTVETDCTADRSGILCGACRDGFSLTLGPPTCQPCSDRFLSLLFLFAVCGLLLVTFIKLLDLTVTRATINGLLFYANVVWINRYLFFDSRETSFTFVFLAWLNLDLGIVTCFYNGLDTYVLTWLQYIFPLYVSLLAVLLVALSRCSPRLLPSANSLSALATIFLLVYTKILRNIVDSLRATHVGSDSELVWAGDGNLQYLGNCHVYLFTAAVILLVFFWLPYTLLLLTGHRVLKISHSRCGGCFSSVLKTYHTALQPNKKVWVGLLLAVRSALLLASAVIPAGRESLNILLTLLLSLLLLYLLTRWGCVYKDKYVGQLETSFIFNVAVLAAVQLYMQSTGGGRRLAVVQTSTSVVFVKFLLILIYHFYCCVRHVGIVRSLEAEVKRCLPRRLVERKTELVRTISLTESLTINSNESSPSHDSQSPPHTSWAGALSSHGETQAPLMGAEQTKVRRGEKEIELSQVK